MSAPKKICRTLNAEGVTRIPQWKYDALRAVILQIISEAGAEGFVFKDLADTVRSRLNDDILSRLGSVMWHTTTVKLDMEVTGDIARIPDSKPQRLVAVPR